MKKFTTLTLLSLVLFTGCTSSNEDYVDAVLDRAEQNTKLMIEKVEKTNSIKYPRTIKDDKMSYVGIYDWTSGFFPGTLWYLSELSKDNKEYWVDQAVKFSDFLNPVQYYSGNHDTGFMMMSSFGNGYRFQNREDFVPELVMTARTLMERYRPQIGAIQSWGAITPPPASDSDVKGHQCPVIIDNMMNLELWFEVTALTGDSTFYDAAVSHADVTMKNHFREDNSSYHLVDYSLITGDVLKKVTAQGWKDESAWARGQAWGLYGYTMTYRYTKEPRFLEQANKIAEFILAESHKIEDGIFYWDYDVEKSAENSRDASAAAIVASALYELDQYAPSEGYREEADRMLKSLCSAGYFAEVGENENFLLKHSTGHFRANIEVDVPLNYADYYFLEALYRQKQANRGEQIGFIAPRLEPNKDRNDWLSAMDRISRPLLENLANETLIKNMPVEHGDRAPYTHLEALGRLLTGIGPWLGSETGDDNEVALRKEYRDLVIKGISNAVNPSSPDFMDFGAGSQNLVDAAFLSHGLLRCREAIWEKLDKTTQERLLESFVKTNKFKPSNNNWVLFTSLVQIGIREFGGTWDEKRVQYSIDCMKDWYKGDGVYGDGEHYKADYYNSFVMQPMLTFTIEYLEANGIKSTMDSKTQIERNARYAAILERSISPEGTFPMFGRSIAYRFGAFYALSDAAYRHILPVFVQPAQVRCALTAVINRQISAKDTFDKDGWLKLGFAGSQPSVAEGYISTGSLYLCSAVFPALGLSTDDPFWSDPYTEWSGLKGWNGRYLRIDHSIK